VSSRGTFQPKVSESPTAITRRSALRSINTKVNDADARGDLASRLLFSLTPRMVTAGAH